MNYVVLAGRITAPAITIIIIYVIILKPTLAKRIYFDSRDCTENSKHISNVNLSLINGSLYFEGNLHYPITSGLNVLLVLDIRSGNANSNVYNTLYRYDMDLCRILNSKRLHLFKKWLTTGIKFGNFYDTCPVPAGYYYVRGWNLESKLVPSFLPNGFYRVLVNVGYGQYGSKKEELFMKCVFNLRLKD